MRACQSAIIQSWPENRWKKYCSVSREGRRLLEKAYEKMNLSARAYHKILKTARTIADLDGEEEIKESQISEAVCYRGLEKRKV